MKHHTLFYGSSYDRGLDVLLKLWPRILEKFPEATLHIAYGWDLFDKATVANKERQAWKAKMVELMKQPGIIHHGRLGKKALREVRKQCGILAYPTYFTEIFMITAIEAQADGLVVVAPNLAALSETAHAGLLVDGSIYTNKTKEAWLEALFSLMGDEAYWKKKSKEARAFVKQGYAWDQVASAWKKVFETPESQDIRVTVFTPTLREGFWNIMANALARQTYTNFEWLIVDDHPDDRSAIAAKYAKQYGLDIVYVRGTKTMTRHPYALAQANNTALHYAQGQLLVFLQDFIIPHTTGIEEFVREHRRHPNALIAGVDVYYSMREDAIDRTNSEDWFNGNLNPFGTHLRTNVRVQGQGLTVSKEATDFEQNWGAIPVAVAQAMGGWWEFYDEALGWDNTDMAWRAMMAGHPLIVDQTNIAVCLDHWQALGKDEGGTSVNRTRRLNDPRFYWMVTQVKQYGMSLVRDATLEPDIDLSYEIPDDVADEHAVDWMREHLDTIVSSWPTYETLRNNTSIS